MRTHHNRPATRPFMLGAIRDEPDDLALFLADEDDFPDHLDAGEGDDTPAAVLRLL